VITVGLGAGGAGLAYLGYEGIKYFMG